MIYSVKNGKHTATVTTYLDEYRSFRPMTSCKGDAIEMTLYVRRNVVYAKVYHNSRT